MTLLSHGRLARFVTRRLLLLPLSLLAACAAPGGLTPPSSISAPPPVAAASAVPVADAASAAAAAPDAAASAPDDDVVATAPAPVDPVEPDVRIDLDARSARTDLWERVRNGFAMADLDNDRVHDSEQWYADRPDYVQRMTERGSRYLFHIVEELQRRDMPTELALLPFIESAYNPQAMSTARASGMWQFIPSTGKDYALKQNIFRDDRRDVLASTRAALDYLQRLHAMFDDWHLALAAYNWGEGNVQRAIARNARLGLPLDYEHLKMPAETANYVPKLQAVKNIVAHPDRFGLTLPVLKNHPYFLSVPIERDMDVDTAVALAGMPLDEFKTLNPQMNQPVILAAGTPQVLLPYDNANRFVRELPRHRGPLATWTAWVAPKTLHPAEAARRVGMTEAQLRQVNRIPPRMLVKAGSTLLVPRGEHRMGDVPEDIADNATMAFAPDAPPLRKLSLRAGRHESVATLARRYHVDRADVARWNDVSTGAHFKRGQTVVVYVAHRPAVHRTARSSTHRAHTRTATRSRSGPPATRAVAAKKAAAHRQARTSKGRASTHVAEE